MRTSKGDVEKGEFIPDRWHKKITSEKSMVTLEIIDMVQKETENVGMNVTLHCLLINIQLRMFPQFIEHQPKIKKKLIKDKGEESSSDFLTPLFSFGFSLSSKLSSS